MTAFNGLKNNQSLRLVLIALSYIALNQFSILFAFPESQSIGLWFPAGLTLGAMLLFGSRVWPAVAIGSLISSMLLFLHFGVVFNLESILTMTLMATVNTLEALFALFLIKKTINKQIPLGHTSNVFLFILIIIATTFIGASLIALAMSTSAIIPPSEFLLYVFKYGLANFVSILIVTPFLLSWARPFRLSISKKILFESTLFVLALGLVVSFLFLEAIANTVEKSFPFLVMPFIFWLAFRASRQLITLYVLILSITSLYLTTTGIGPFVLAAETESILILQIFLSIISITALIINATVQERFKAERALKLFNEKLESRVKERTKALKEEINIRKATEEKIKVSNKKLRKANTELDNFVYSVSHDLRAPIASVLGLVNLAKKERSVKAMRTYLAMIAKSAEQQDAFIKDILDLSRNSRLEVMHNDIDFQEIINNIFEHYQYIDQNKKIVKSIAIEQNVPLQSDKSRIKVILNNIISNAIRHCNTEEVKLNVRIEVNETLASIEIKDNGAGIPKEHLDSIFKMFYRGTDSTAGSGLGLYIVNETIEKLRGAITIDSEENIGTTVKIELPNLYDKKALA